MYNYLYSRPLWLVALAIIVGIALWSWLGNTLSTKSPEHRAWTAINGVLLFLSLCTILYITLFRRSIGTQDIDLCPFHSFVAARQQPELYREMVMNVFLFVPFGLTLSALLPPIWAAKHRFLLVVVLGIAISIAVEWAQYYFKLGTAETDDVICNFIGALLGAIPILFVPHKSVSLTHKIK